MQCAHRSAAAKDRTWPQEPPPRNARPQPRNGLSSRPLRPLPSLTQRRRSLKQLAPAACSPRREAHRRAETTCQHGFRIQCGQWLSRSVEMKPFLSSARDDAFGFVKVDFGIRDAQFRIILTVITTPKTRMRNTSQAGFSDTHTHVYARAQAPCAVATQQGPAKPPYCDDTLLMLSHSAR